MGPSFRRTGSRCGAPSRTSESSRSGRELVKKLPHITSVQYLGEFRVRLGFSDGREGEVDFGDEFVDAPGRLGQLADRDFFSRVFLDKEAGTIAWPNKVDFDPIVLYCEATGTPLKEIIPSAEELLKRNYRKAGSAS